MTLPDGWSMAKDATLGGRVSMPPPRGHTKKDKRDSLRDTSPHQS
jgi:hypothetical protein